MEPRKIGGAADARACLAAVETSGLSRVAWARAHGVDARSLNAWRLILDRASGRSSARPLRLVELVSDAPAPNAVHRVRCGPFEVDIEGEIDEDRLVRLLRAVAAAC